MSVLRDYEKRMNLAPLTDDEITSLVEDVEDDLESDLAGPTTMARSHVIARSRVILLLAERIQAVPPAAVCLWCWDAAGRTDEAWRSLPRVSVDDAKVHVAACEHNPVAIRVRELEAGIREAASSIVPTDQLRDAIRGLIR